MAGRAVGFDNGTSRELKIISPAGQTSQWWVAACTYVYTYAHDT